jgi:hypothetical protein
MFDDTKGVIIKLRGIHNFVSSMDGDWTHNISQLYTKRQIQRINSTMFHRIEYLVLWKGMSYLI